MCGIIGLLIKNPEQRHLLGEWLLPMFECMTERGPDSAGLASFGDPVGDGLRRYSIFAPDRAYDWASLAAGIERDTGVHGELHACTNHAVLVTAVEPMPLAAWLHEHVPETHLLGAGRSMDLYKDMGEPMEMAARYHFADLTGTHAIGHTRMATESAVSPAHAHPFTAGEDFCLVHNGSLSNPYMLRRKLEAEGLTFETDNDSEAACRYIEWQTRQGKTLDEALHTGFAELDGFYTLLIATGEQLTLVRDAFACKPAVVAETPDYVAISSEFRSLAHLPGVENANMFEPLPEEIYSWRV